VGGGGGGGEGVVLCVVEIFLFGRAIRNGGIGWSLELVLKILLKFFLANKYAERV